MNILSTPTGLVGRQTVTRNSQAVGLEMKINDPQMNPFTQSDGPG